MLSVEEFRKKFPQDQYGSYKNFTNKYGIITNENIAIERINNYWNADIYKTFSSDYINEAINNDINTFRTFKNQYIEDFRTTDTFEAINDLIKYTDDIDYARQLIKENTSPQEYNDIIKLFNDNTSSFRSNWKSNSKQSNKNYRNEPPPKEEVINNNNSNNSNKRKRRKTKQERKERARRNGKTVEETATNEEWNSFYNDFKQKQNNGGNNGSNNTASFDPYDIKNNDYFNRETTEDWIKNNTGINMGQTTKQVIFDREDAIRWGKEEYKQFEKLQKKYNKAQRNRLLDSYGDSNNVAFLNRFNATSPNDTDIFGYREFNNVTKSNYSNVDYEEAFNRKYADDLFDIQKNAIRSGSSTAAKEATEEVIKDTTKEAAEDVAEDIIINSESDSLSKIFNMKTIGFTISALSAVGEYKDNRNAGDGVVKSGVKAAGTFVMAEALGAAYMPYMIAKSAPRMAVKAVTGLQQMTRQMNSYQRIQTFGDAYFQDTQQLATMRQAGMELAKMSQYNLQQAIMGNEAQYMHRI